MTEAVQGPNKTNQEYLFNSKLIEFMKDYVLEHSDSKLIFKNEAKASLIEEIINKSVNLLNGMLEGNNKRTALHLQIFSHIKMEPLVEILTSRFIDYWKGNPEYLKYPTLDKKLLRNFIRTNTFDDEMQEMFNAFFFIKYQVEHLTQHYPDF